MNTVTSFEFKANLILRGKIICKTGMHIGGSKEKLEIGGVDSIVIRSLRTDYPFIPGSSIKGKMRHLLEFFTGGVNDPIIVNKKKEWEGDEERIIRENLGNVSKSPQIVRLFGIGANEREDKKNNLDKLGLTRLVVRDAHPDDDTINIWENLSSDSFYTEYKAENTIDRLTSAANPRFIERVVEGSKFNFEMVYSVFYMGEEDFLKEINQDIKNLLTAMRLLETSALGKSGSRGYGKISFELANPIWIYKDHYESEEKWKETCKALETNEFKPLSDITFEEIKYNA